MPGAVLQMPAPTTYIVQSGDTLAEIAAAAGTTVGELVALNALQGTRIFAGQTLTLNGAAKPLVITVEPNESLWLIAERFGVSTAALSAANGLSASAMLEIGDTLTVPRSLRQRSRPGGGAQRRA